VQESLRKLAPISDSAIALFYARWFELDPELRGCCRGAMAVENHRLMRSIVSIVARLESFEALRPSLRRIGARQSWRGLSEEHYATAGAAFLWTLERTLGTAFTPAVKAAWTRCYVEVATAMMDGAQMTRKAA
jgi:Hemoglobin-like flavoprotein